MKYERPNHALETRTTGEIRRFGDTANPAIASLLQSKRPAGWGERNNMRELSLCDRLSLGR